MRNSLKKVLIGGVALSFLFSVPNILTKIETEKSSNTVEITADYRHIYMSSKTNKDVTDEQILDTLKRNGVTTIGLNQNTLSSLEERELVHVYSGNKFEKSFWNIDLGFQIQKEHTYVVVPAGDAQKEIIQTLVKSRLGILDIKQWGEVTVLDIDAEMNSIYKQPILYLESDYLEISENFFISPRISNNWGERIDLIKTQLSDWNTSKKLSNVVFEASEVVGYDVETNKTQTDAFLRDIGVGSIEVFDAKQKQKGINEYIKESNYHANRLHSIPSTKMNDISKSEMSILVEKAAKERNIRIFYLNIPSYDGAEKPEEFLEKIEEKVATIHDTLEEEAGFVIGQASPFVESNNKWLSLVSTFAAMFGSLLLFLLSLYYYVESKTTNIPGKLFYLAIISGGALILSALESEMLQSISSLGLSILLPVWTGLLLMNKLDAYEITQKNMFQHIIVPVVGLYLAGLSFLTAINYDIDKVLYLQGFKGVSLTISLPPILIGLFILFHFKDKFKIGQFFTHKIRIIDILVIAILGMFFVYYESRSGNAGSLLPFESNIRHWLEETLPVRPRTKEVFFAFPLLVVMIAFWKESRWIRLLLPFVIIGFASVFNTFTHFHTPLEYSFTRSVLSIVMGIVIGLILTMFLKPIYEEYKKAILWLGNNKKSA